MRHYSCEYYECDAPDECCLFCEHCTDIFYDCGGPYLFLCELGCPDWRTCNKFEEERDGE